MQCRRDRTTRVEMVVIRSFLKVCRDHMGNADYEDCQGWVCKNWSMAYRLCERDKIMSYRAPSNSNAKRWKAQCRSQLNIFRERNVLTEAEIRRRKQCWHVRRLLPNS
jgi:hypothetical protein